MTEAAVPPPLWRRQIWLRAAVTLVSLALVALWVGFETDMIRGSEYPPAPGGLMMPVLFCVLALGAIFAAWRGEGAPVIIAGGISLFPMGIVFAFYPGPPRWVGLLDVCLIALGILLIRADERPVGREAEAPE